MKKILISVLACENGIYPNLEAAARQTWVKTNNNCNVIFYYGKKGVAYLYGDRIYLDCEDVFENVALKTLLMYEYVLDNFDFDYVYRTNLSSFVNIPKLQEYVIDKPLNLFYNAIIGDHEGITFASGSGYFISKDLVKMLVHNKKEINYNLIDDVAIGDFFQKRGILPTLGKRKDISEDNMFSLSEEEILSHYHFRCKCLDRNNDIVIFNKLYQIISS